jgi:hypothetical protein
MTCVRCMDAVCQTGTIPGATSGHKLALSPAIEVRNKTCVHAGKPLALRRDRKTPSRAINAVRATIAVFGQVNVRSAKRGVAMGAELNALAPIPTSRRRSRMALRRLASSSTTITSGSSLLSCQRFSLATLVRLIASPAMLKGCYCPRCCGCHRTQHTTGHSHPRVPCGSHRC